MSKKQSRWHETLVNKKTNKPTQKNGGKDLAALAVPACDGGKQTGSGAAKTSVSCGRSSSLSSKGGDSTVTGSKFGGSRSSLSHQGGAGHQVNRQASHPSKPALRLRSSRSFSSLQATSLSAAPFMRSSRSLSRLDQRSTESDKTSGKSQVKKGQNTGKKILDSVRLSSSVEQISSSCQPQTSSSSLVSTTTCHHHNIKEKKQTRDGVYSLCAMTSGMKRNLVQAVLKNVRPGLTHDTTSSLPEQKVDQLEEDSTGEWEEASQQQQPERTAIQQPEGEQSLVDLHSSSSLLPVSSAASPPPSPTSPSHQVEEGEGVHECQLPVETAQTGGIESSSCAKGSPCGSSASKVVLSSNEDFEEHSNRESENEQSLPQREATPQKHEQSASVNTTSECTEDNEALSFEQQTGQLVKELEQTQRELCRVQQLNRNLQNELQQERDIHSRKLFFPQNTNSSSEQTLAFQQLQRVNHNLRMELETLKRSQEEAREAELRRRVDLLAQQAQLLVTGDATALAQIHLQQDRQKFQEQQLEWERSMASLKSQLNISEEKRKETESHLNQLQQELEGQQSLQQEAEQLRKHLQEMSAQLRAYEEAQAEKDARLQKHLMLLQASQERERRSLAASLDQAEQHSQDLQDKLNRAEQQVDSLNKTQTWTREIEEAQRQLQEELACTVSAVQRLQEEREQLDHRCQELQSQLSEADREVSRLQERLKTEETHYYNLEHSYERACEELQVALSKVQQRESETQDIREGYDRLLDRKEQELTEVLLKMEVLGNSLEETEVKLSEAMKICTCTFSQLRDETSDYIEQKEEQQISEPFTVNGSRASMVDSFQLSESTNVSQVNSSDPHEHARSRSGSTEASNQYTSTEGDDAEKFMSVIQLLETKLFVTEEKLRDITQGLEEHQGHISCQDPHLCSQLTQSRATSQHLSLLLHSQAKQSQRFAQETENRCRMLVGRFQVALNIIQACRERIQATLVNIPDLERQLATVAACLQQGEKDAERVQHDSYNVSVEEGKILKDEKLAASERDILSKLTNTWSLHDIASAEKYLIRELFVVEKMVSFLQSQDGISHLASISRQSESDIAHSYKNIISERIVIKTRERMESGRLDCETDEALENIIGRVCVEAELIYAALKLQQHQSMTQESNQDMGLQREGLADISPSELAPYDEQVEIDSRGSGKASKLVEGEQSDDKLIKVKKERAWLERFISRLQRRAKFLRKVYQDICNDNSPVREDSVDITGDNASTADLNFFQEQVKLIYLSDRLYLDLEEEFQQSEMLQNKLQTLCDERDVNLMAEQEALNHTLYQLQEDNNALKEELELAEQNIISVETGNQKLLEDIQKIEDYHEERMQKLETKFHKKITELQQIHEEEMKQLHSYYSKSCVSKEKQSKHDTETPHVTDGLKDSSLSDQVVTERKTTEDLVEPDAVAMRKAYLQDLEKLQASCDQGFAAMEEMHRKLIRDLQQQHQKQVAELLKEKDQLLQEETAATMAAIVAMRRAHKQELERSKWSQHIRESADITELQMEYEKEIQLLHRELEVLSAQHTEKCLENSQLSQDLQEERKSVMHYQKENQELKKKQRDTDEMSELHGNQTHGAPQVNNYQMEMTLRAKEAEIQFLRQEARSLREQLEIAGMDKVYMQNKLKTLNTIDGSHQSVKDSKFATWSPSRDTPGHSLNDSVTTTSKSAFAKKTEKSSIMRQIRGIRSKSLKDGLSLHERLKLFE